LGRSRLKHPGASRESSHEEHFHRALIIVEQSRDTRGPRGHRATARVLIAADHDDRIVTDELCDGDQEIEEHGVPPFQERSETPELRHRRRKI
jgi:hypothetical protein